MLTADLCGGKNACQAVYIHPADWVSQVSERIARFVQSRRRRDKGVSPKVQPAPAPRGSSWYGGSTAQADNDLVEQMCVCLAFADLRHLGGHWRLPLDELRGRTFLNQATSLLPSTELSARIRRLVTFVIVKSKAYIPPSITVHARFISF